MSEDYIQQCCDKATEFISKGDYERAKKFLKKAADRDPGNSKVIALLQIIASREHTNSNNTEPGMRQRHAAPEPPSEASGDFTPEQKELAESINKKNNYYEILGIEKNASQSDIKKAYRKLAIKLHPDKNKAPGADEAFKRISAAFSTLSDEEKRTEYDNRPLQGDNENVFSSSNPGTSRYNDFGAVDPEEIFRMFFGSSGFGPGGVFQTANGNVYRTHFSTGFPFHQHREHQQPSFMQRFLPIIFIVIYILLSVFLRGYNEAPYSVEYSPKYNVRREQPDTGIPYYVKSDFDSSRSNVRYVERDLLSEYFKYYQQQCVNDIRIEKQKKERRPESELPHCIKYREVQSVLKQKYGYY